MLKSKSTDAMKISMKTKQEKSMKKKINIRRRFMIISFLIVIPLLLIGLLYHGTYQESTRTSFNSDATKDIVAYRSYQKIDQLDHFNFTVELDKINAPKKGDDDKLTEGYYRFVYLYTNKASVTVKNVNITPLLQTKWSNLRSLGYTTYLDAGTKRTSSVTYNFELPTTTLLFIKVERPDLYLKVRYELQGLTGLTEQTIYVRVPLKDLNIKTQ